MRLHLFKEYEYLNNTLFYTRFQCFKQAKYKRPFLSELYPSDTWYRYLNNDIHEWLTFTRTEYKLTYNSTDTNGWYIDMPYDKAILFKLTWM
jgi:hypothetical protein